LYHQRKLVETVSSVLKRKFGESLIAGKFRYQVREIIIIVVNATSHTNHKRKNVWGWYFLETDALNTIGEDRIVKKFGLRP